MLSRISTAIHNVIVPRWNARFPDMKREAKAAADAGLTPEQAYLAGTRNAYWDAVVDLVAAGLIKTPPAISALWGDPEALDRAH